MLFILIFLASWDRLKKFSFHHAILPRDATKHAHEPLSTFATMSGDDAAEMAALVADFGLSVRGAQATKPPFSYLHAFFKAMAEPWEEGTREDGYINLAVAQNFLTVDAVQDRLRKAMASEQPPSTAAYDNMRGSERLRKAMAARDTAIVTFLPIPRLPHFSSSNATRRFFFVV